MIDFEKLFQDALGVHQKVMEKNFGDKMNKTGGDTTIRSGTDEDKNMKGLAPFEMDPETAQFMVDSMSEDTKRYVTKYKPELKSKLERSLQREITSSLEEGLDFIKDRKNKQELYGTWGLFGEILRKIPVTDSKNYSLDRHKADAIFTVSGINDQCVSMLCTYSKTGVGMSRAHVFSREKFTRKGIEPRLKYFEDGTRSGYRIQ